MGGELAREYEWAVVVIQLPMLEENRSGILAARESSLLCSFKNILFPLMREQKAEREKNW